MSHSFSRPSNDLAGHFPCVLLVPLFFTLLCAKEPGPHGPVSRLPCLWVPVGFYQNSVIRDEEQRRECGWSVPRLKSTIPAERLFFVQTSSP